MNGKDGRRGIQSVEIAFRMLLALQSSRQALPLKEIAVRAELTSSAANNYLVSLVRTGLAMADEKPGHYKLGPASLRLGMASLGQLNGFEMVRREVIALHDATRLSAAVTVWTADGPVSLFKEEGEVRGAFEMRTGLIGLLGTAAGKIYIASLPTVETRRQLQDEALALSLDPEVLRAEAERQLASQGYVSFERADGTGYASIAGPVRDWSGGVKFTLSVVGWSGALNMKPSGPHVNALLKSCTRATIALGGTAAS
ncbi:IclR family transcriptional regulator [Bosea caraganae]|nr:helix-turn-helix domain-containing protein [Bosea caraganae]